MLEQQIILKSDKVLDTRSPFKTNVWAAHNLSFSFENLGLKEVMDVQRDPKVISIAPVMPIYLIKPLDISNVALDQEVVPEAAWGIEAVAAHLSRFTGKGVKVAVLDTGIDAEHPAFKGVDFTFKDFTLEGQPDIHGHGTHCAGTIFGRDSGYGRIGIARGVSEVLIGKVIGAHGGDTQQVVNAIQWASENGVNIVSMSLGIDFPGKVASLVESGLPVELATSRALDGYRANIVLFERLASLIRARGSMIIIAAAGNESRRTENPEYEIGVSPPAVAEGIISVAALGQVTNSLLDVAPFSNTGANIAAPGVQIISAKLNGGFTKMSGTSMATPHVAGVAALWAEALIEQGQFNAANLAVKLLGSGVNKGFVPKLDLFDVGMGLVQAPIIP
jgi:subtilisin family serine protease